MLIQLLSYFSILFTFTILIYWPFINHFKQGPFIVRTKPYVVGLKFGITGLILTFAAIELFDGLMVNLRIVVVLFSGLLGGPISLLISGLVIGIGRFFLPDLSSYALVLNFNFLLVTVGLFLISWKIPMSARNISTYFWLTLAELIVAFTIVFLLFDQNVMYIALVTVYTSFSFYFIYVVIYQVKTSNDTVQQTSYLHAIDYLTKLPNNNVTNAQIQNLMKKNTTFTMLLVNINDFRLVNSLYGYVVGDSVILQLGEVFQQYAQKNDVLVGRIGGDEFLVVLKDVAPATAVVEANNLIQSIAKQSFNGPKNTEIHISVSVGLCSYPNNGEDMHTLTKNLILAQQHAKANSISSYFHASNLK